MSGIYTAQRTQQGKIEMSAWELDGGEWRHSVAEEMVEEACEEISIKQTQKWEKSQFWLGFRRVIRNMQLL